MFKNLKITFKMASPVATIGYIYLDSILSAAKAKEKFGEGYYNNSEAGAKELIDEMLSPILDKKYDVYCASVGIGDNREFVTSWSKRWDDKNDDMVVFEKGKPRIDIGSGHYKNYHMPLVMKSYKEIVFYAKGDKEEIERLLKSYIFYVGKKGSQGYGRIREIIVEEIEEDWSLFKDGKPMRPIPARYFREIELQGDVNFQRHPIIPPYWRNDYIEVCIMPTV